jgi:two-component system aerobic respiration control protein ArcA
LILIVDDESGARQLLTRLVTAQGHVSLEAGTAEEALYLCVFNSNIHVVIADIQMPGHGGGWLIEQLRQRCPAVAIIVATAHDLLPGTLSLEPSVIGYLVKPIDGEQLAEAVTLGIRWHEQQLKASRRDK